MSFVRIDYFEQLTDNCAEALAFRARGERPIVRLDRIIKLDLIVDIRVADHSEHQQFGAESIILYQEKILPKTHQNRREIPVPYSLDELEKVLPMTTKQLIVSVRQPKAGKS